MNDKDFNLSNLNAADELKTMEPQKIENLFYSEVVKSEFEEEINDASASIESDIVVEQLIIEDVAEIRETEKKEVFFCENIKPAKKEKKTDSFKRFVAAVLIVSVIGGSAFGFTFGASQKLFGNKADSTNNAVAVGNQGDYDYSESMTLTAGNVPINTVQATMTQNLKIESMADIIDMVEPSVVGLNVLTQPTMSNYGLFFDSRRSSELVGSSGSGIIFRETEDKVFIVTNNHVIENAVSVTVSIMNSEPVKASYIGSDSQNDLAVISVDKNDLAEAGIKTIVLASFGNSDNLRMGDIAIAIGNALGEGNTATAGIVSAVNKVVPDGDRRLEVVQTDAAINPGNSGGPLVNSSGEVIGINTAKLVDTQVEGWGFAIPINVAKPIIEELVNNGDISRPYMGISGSNLTEEAAAIYDIPMGVLVRQLVSDGPAEKAGLKVTDIIIDVNGDKIITMDNLTEIIQKHKVGDTLTVTVVRNGTDKVTVEVTLQDSNSDKVKW